jgi:hypothetical protein
LTTRGKRPRVGDQRGNVRGREPVTVGIAGPLPARFARFARIRLNSWSIIFFLVVGAVGVGNYCSAPQTCFFRHAQYGQGGGLADRRRNWVVIAGLVRDEAVFAHQLEVLIEWRKKQLVEGIVYCTWLDELSKYPRISSFLSDQEIAFIEVAEPTLRLEGHILHQMTSLHYGLQLVPDETYVLRTRPDMRLTQEMQDFLQNEPSLLLGAPDDWPEIFGERLVVLACSLLTPFYINDMIFYGRKNDVSKLVSFDIGCEMIYANMAPEQFYFAPPFCRALPIFRSFFQLSAPYSYDDRDWARRFIVQHMASDFFLQVWLTYLLCLDRYFRISFDEQTRARAEAEHASLRDLSLGNILFRNKTVPSLSFHAATQLPLLETETCVSAILNDVFRHDAYATRINKLLPTLKDWSFQERWSANPLLVGDDVRKFAMVVEGLGQQRSRIDELDDTSKRRFRIGSSGHRWSVLGSGDSVHALTAEVNGLRRTTEALREEIRVKDAEIARLKR